MKAVCILESPLNIFTFRAYEASLEYCLPRGITPSFLLTCDVHGTFSKSLNLGGPWHHGGYPYVGLIELKYIIGRHFGTIGINFKKLIHAGKKGNQSLWSSTVIRGRKLYPQLRLLVSDSSSLYYWIFRNSDDQKPSPPKMCTRTCHKGPITAYQTHRTSPQANKWKRSALRHVDSTHVKRKAGPSMLRDQEQSIT